jgi:hypothetical protein
VRFADESGYAHGSVTTQNRTEEFILSTTSDFIATTFGVTMAQAHDFIMAHVSDPAYIYNMAAQYHVTSAMLGEITGYSATDVEGFFTANGLDGTALRTPAGTTSGPQLLAVEGASIPDSVVKLDTYQGVLSTASLHDAIVAKTGQAAYDQAFSAAPYDTNHDGVLSASELGTTSLGSLPATEATIESIFFGTVVNALKSFDATELTDLSSFVEANSAALDAGDAATTQQMLSMLIADISTPTDTPVVTDSMAIDAIVQPVADMISLMGTGAGGSLFNAVLIA